MNREGEKPLYVRVAEALGCAPKLNYREWECTCKGLGHATHTVHDACDSETGLACEKENLARYDLDWSATGPLIDQLGLMVHGDTREVAHRNIRARVDEDHEGPVWFRGATTLEAVCACILALAEEGMLKDLLELEPPK